MASFRGGQVLRILMLLAVVTGPASGFGDTELGAIVGHQPDLSRYGDPGGLWMGRELRYSIDGGGNVSSNEHMIARVIRPDWGAAHFSPFQVHYWAEHQAVRVERARVWKSRTEFVDLPGELVNYGPSPLAQGSTHYDAMRTLEINFPDLDEGDVVEILLERNDRILPGEFAIRWFTHLYGDNIATVEERVSITAPSALAPFIEQSGSKLREYRRNNGGFVERFWTTGHLPAFTQGLEQSFHSRRSVEGQAVPDSSSQLVFSTSNWIYMSRYFGRAWNRIVNEVSPEMRQKIGEITRDRNGAARARVIESWIQSGITTLPINHRHQGLRPQAPSLTFAEAKASTVDKTILLVAALRVAGLHGFPVLIRTREEAWLSELGCPDQLDRFLVRVRTSGGDVLWLDPVESETSFPETVGWIIPLSEYVTDDDDQTETGLIDVPGR